MEQKRAAVYCRVDGPVSDNTGLLIRSQKERLMKYAQNHNFKIACVYEDDRDIIGLNQKTF